MKIVTLMWTPAHVGIESNERADAVCEDDWKQNSWGMATLPATEWIEAIGAQNVN